MTQLGGIRQREHETFLSGLVVAPEGPSRFPSARSRSIKDNSQQLCQRAPARHPTHVKCFVNCVAIEYHWLCFTGSKTNFLPKLGDSWA